MFRFTRSSLGFLRSPRKTLLVALLVAAACVSSSNAAEVIIHVTGLSEPLGRVGCALFSDPTGFPTDIRSARSFWLPAEAKGITCRFNDVPEGSYALSVIHDQNNNERVDIDPSGAPTEQWGVSNNAQPPLRAPRFDEALFTVAVDTEEVVLDIKLVR